MRCLQRIGQGPATTQPAAVNGSGGAWGSSYCRVDDLSTPISGVFTSGQVDVLATIVFAVKTEHLNLPDVSRRIESLNNFSHIIKGYA